MPLHSRSGAPACVDRIAIDVVRAACEEYGQPVIRTGMSPTATDRRAASAVDESIDRALWQPTDAQVRAVARLAPATAVVRFAERVRRRATRLARRRDSRRAAIVAARDRLMLAIYARATPAGWHTAWCDGSVGAGMASIGGLLMTPSGRILAEVARRAPGIASFEAEIAALLAVLQLAQAHGVRRLRVYTDCIALARRWHQFRDDPRLAAAAALAGRFARLEIASLPRLHNQPAHRLARTGSLDG